MSDDKKSVTIKTILDKTGILKVMLMLYHNT